MTIYQPAQMIPDEAELFLPLILAAHEKQPDAGDVTAKYAETLAALGRRDEALALLQQAAEKNPDDGFVRGALFHLECAVDAVLSQAVAGLPLRMEKLYGHPLLQPAPHESLLEKMQVMPRLNRTLGHITDAMIHGGYQNLTAIDLGAYIGSSVAEMNAQHAVPCLSVDCWPRHFALTRHNLRYVKGDHTAVMMAIGRDDEHLHILLPRRYTDPDHIFLSPQGPDADNQEVGRVPAISLSSLLAQHPRYADSKLLKLDLEGHEAAVLSGCGDVLQRNHPVIFWEYNYEYVRDAAPSHAAFMQVFAMLRGYGYDQHLFFAATGELICRVGADQTETLQSLSAYLLMARQGWPVPYFDVCSLHRDNAALALPITERALGPKIFTAAYR